MIKKQNVLSQTIQTQLENYKSWNYKDYELCSKEKLLEIFTEDKEKAFKYHAIIFYYKICDKK